MASKKSRHLTEKQRVAKERRKSKKLGYSLTYVRHKKERAASKKALKTAKDLSKYVPALKPLAKKTRLTPQQRAQVTHYAKALSGVTNLVPVSKSYAKKHKDELFVPVVGIGKGKAARRVHGIQAARFRNASENAKYDMTDDNLVIETNGRTWVYWRLDIDEIRNKNGKLVKAGGAAFDKKFPIERVVELAQIAFDNMEVKAITLWTHAGRIDSTFADLKAFIRFVHQHWQAGKYVRFDDEGEISDTSDPGKWIHGLAIWVDKLPPKKRKKGKQKGKRKSKR